MTTSESEGDAADDAPKEREEATSESDVDDREPCGDELCTGIVHVDTGLCGTCGRAR